MARVPPFMPLYAPLTEKLERSITQLLDLVHAMDPVPELFVLARARNATPDPPTLENEERLVAYACLVTCCWSVPNAFAKVQAMAKHRRELQLDRRQFMPTPISLRGYDQEDIVRHFGLTGTPIDEDVRALLELGEPFTKTGFHYWDKRGLPVAYCCLGKINVRTLVKQGLGLLPPGISPTEFAMRYASFVIESGWALCRYQNERLRAHPDPSLNVGSTHRNFITIVVDVTGLSMGTHVYLPAIGLVMKIAEKLDQVYFDICHRILVVNCTPFVKMGYSLIKHLLSNTLRERITLVSVGDTKEALDRVIGLARVPQFLGGQCRCPGGCIASYHTVPVFPDRGTVRKVLMSCGGTGTREVQGVLEYGDSAHGDEAARAEDGGDPIVSTTLNISGGGKFQKAFEVLEGEDVLWDFSSPRGQQFMFSVYFFPRQSGVTLDKKRDVVTVDASVAANSTATEQLIKALKTSENTNHYTVESNGFVHFVWGNPSRFFSRSLRVHVDKLPRTAIGIDKACPTVTQCA